ncbi:protein translocase subunit SecD [candidate division TA06 bacterium]|uniref:Protein translocase subunit SecD n=1 Tax=candidate division TA06 bacterium TaxID=2250710 RepID=A0A933IAE1_UNCT6|nr:protein translocase subunit SecD [candidate division TA06 bacterium]
MRKANRWKALLTVVLLVAAVWQLVPTFKLQGLTEAQKAEMPREELNRLYAKAIHLGLDLKGGMHLVMEINRQGLAKAMGKEPSEITDKELSDATDRALEIIRNRVDQFGVAEPSIQKQGADRIVVQLPGVDQDRARGLIGTTALLEFKLVQEDKVTMEVLDKIDQALLSDKTRKIVSDSAMLGTEDKPFSALMAPTGSELMVMEQDKRLVEKLLADPLVVAAIPPDYQFLWGEKSSGDNFRGYALYLMKKQPEITGASLAEARMGVGTADNPGGLYVDFVLVRQSANLFSRITAANVKRQLAIVLDGVVKSAPVIQERIPNGRGQITLGTAANPDQAKDLAIILRAGALPAPVEIIEERSVGPSLGQDSINNGIRATIIGGLAVVLFILIYYSLSGLIADLALVFNLVMLLAVMAAFRFTLTLPGIAGIALTVGMAVDANVLIFERIREELRAGKTVRAAIATGYERAFATIFDSNITTAGAAAALLIWGTGPVKGFAVSLIIGLAISMFTAIVVTRLIFEWITVKWNLEKLPI